MKRNTELMKHGELAAGLKFCAQPFSFLADGETRLAFSVGVDTVIAWDLASDNLYLLYGDAAFYGALNRGSPFCFLHPMNVQAVKGGRRRGWTVVSCLYYVAGFMVPGYTLADLRATIAELKPDYLEKGALRRFRKTG